MTFAITKPHFTTNDYHKIDWRFTPYLDNWKVIEQYKGKTVTIPGTWNAEIWPFNYYEVIKIAGDPNSREEENEKELSLACGWRGDGMYDREVQINLRIEGKVLILRKYFLEPNDQDQKHDLVHVLLSLLLRHRN